MAIHVTVPSGTPITPNAGVASVGAAISELPESGDMCNMLLDSGADAAVFPVQLAGCGDDVDEASTKLHDAQGCLIPVQTMRAVEIRLLDEVGRVVLSKEKVAISPHVSQPILCFGRLLQAGWSMDSREQVLTHDAGVKIPIELQNMNVTVKGWVRSISNESIQHLDEEPHASVRAVRADVTPFLRLGSAGWTLDDANCGVGRHHADHFQDSTLVRPQMSGKLFRTTLLRDSGEWYVLELCEPFDTLVDLGAEIYGYDGPRDLLTIITASEQDPAVMGFSLMGDEDVPLFGDAERQEDDVVGREIEDGDAQQGGADVPLEGRLVFAPSPTDVVLANGVELTLESSLKALRTALTFDGLSTSGSKADATRFANAVDLKVPPSEKEQQLHNLTHLPYAPWCASCVCFCAGADRQLRSDGARRAGVATISFGFCCAKSVPESVEEKDVDTMVCLVMTERNCLSSCSSIEIQESMVIDDEGTSWFCWHIGSFKVGLHVRQQTKSIPAAEDGSDSQIGHGTTYKEEQSSTLLSRQFLGGKLCGSYPAIGWNLDALHE
eukprot:s334_g36.t1